MGHSKFTSSLIAPVFFFLHAHLSRRRSQCLFLAPKPPPCFGWLPWPLSHPSAFSLQADLASVASQGHKNLTACRGYRDTTLRPQKLWLVSLELSKGAVTSFVYSNTDIFWDILQQILRLSLYHKVNDRMSTLLLYIKLLFHYDIILKLLIVEIKWWNSKYIYSSTVLLLLYNHFM